MASLRFILQGLTPNTHLDAIRRLFELPSLEKLIVSVAFANKAGVSLLAQGLAKAGSKLDCYVGIRNDITSRQGLQALMKSSANVHYVDTGARNLIFHPKLYFALTRTNARIVIGSANLTPGGLNNNIEASLVVDLDLSNPADRKLADDVAAGFGTLTTEYPKHVVRLDSTAELDTLQEQGRLLDEISTSSPKSLSSMAPGKGDQVPRIKLKVPPITRRVHRATHTLQSKEKQASASPSHKRSPPAPSTGMEFELVWQSKPLAERDLSIPSQSYTHATGSINLDKGLLEPEIDHRHYFREEVFSALNWGPRSVTVDEAITSFRLMVKGVACGEHDLWIRHTNSTTTRAYLQRNAMTRLSWGPMKDFVARRALIGRTMSLYRAVSDPSQFFIEID